MQPRTRLAICHAAHNSLETEHSRFIPAQLCDHKARKLAACYRETNCIAFPFVVLAEVDGSLERPRYRVN